MSSTMVTIIVPKNWCVPASVTGYDEDTVIIDPSEDDGPELLQSKIDMTVYRNLTAGMFTGQDAHKPILSNFSNKDKAAFLNFAAKTKSCKEAKMDIDMAGLFVKYFAIPTEFGPDLTEMVLTRMLDAFYRFVNVDTCSNAYEVRKVDGKTVVYFKAHTRFWVTRPHNDYLRMKPQTSDGFRAGRDAPVDDNDKEIGTTRWLKGAMAILRKSGVWDETYASSFSDAAVETPKVKAGSTTTTTTTTAKTRKPAGVQTTTTTTTSAPPSPVPTPSRPASRRPSAVKAKTPAVEIPASELMSPPIPHASKPRHTSSSKSKSYVNMPGPAKEITPPPMYSGPSGTPSTPHKKQDPLAGTPFENISSPLYKALCLEAAQKSDRVSRNLNAIASMVIDPLNPSSMESRLGFVEALHGKE